MSAPDKVKVSSASRVPPLMDIVEASVPVSLSFMDPPVTVIAPERVLLAAIDTGVMWPTEREVTVEFPSTSRPKLFAEVLALSNVFQFSRSFVFASLGVRTSLTRFPPPLIVIVLAQPLIAAPE